MKVHEKIRALREAKNWSQEDMAAKLNMSVSGYSKIERAKPKPIFRNWNKLPKHLKWI